MNEEEEKREKEIQASVVKMQRYTDDARISDVWPIFELVAWNSVNGNQKYSFVGYSEAPKREGVDYLLINFNTNSQDIFFVFNTRCVNGKYTFEQYQYTFTDAMVLGKYTTSIKCKVGDSTVNIIDVTMGNDMFNFDFKGESTFNHKATATMSALFFAKQKQHADGIGNLVTRIPSNYRSVGVAYGLDRVSTAIWPHVNSLGLNGIIFYYDFEGENIRYETNGVKQEPVGVGVEKAGLLRYIYGIENISAMVKGSGGLYSVQCIYGTDINFNNDQRRGIEWTVVLSSYEHERIIPRHFGGIWPL